MRRRLEDAVNEKVKAFVEAAQADPELNEKLSKLNAEEFIAAARQKGFEITEEDLKPSAGEVNETELASVSGGFCACPSIGGGGGTDSNDGKTYGCACLTYGQGGDGRGGDANCLCVATGFGFDGAQGFC